MFDSASEMWNSTIRKNTNISTPTAVTYCNPSSAVRKSRMAGKQAQSKMTPPVNIHKMA